MGQASETTNDWIDLDVYCRVLCGEGTDEETEKVRTYLLVLARRRMGSKDVAPAQSSEGSAPSSTAAVSAEVSPIEPVAEPPAKSANPLPEPSPRFTSRPIIKPVEKEPVEKAATGARSNISFAAAATTAVAVASIFGGPVGGGIAFLAAFALKKLKDSKQ